MIKKRIAIPYIDSDGNEAEVEIDVDFRILEIVESVFGMNVDWVASQVLVDPRTTRVTLIADTIAGWIGPAVDIKRGKIRDCVLGSSPERMALYVAQIQAACLFVRNHINPEQFDKLARGEGLEETDEKKAEQVTDSSQSESSQSSIESSSVA